MTKDQIRAELRRSAIEDFHPWGGVKWDAYKAADDWDDGRVPSFHHVLDANDVRMFFLFVAEAM